MEIRDAVVVELMREKGGEDWIEIVETNRIDWKMENLVGYYFGGDGIENYLQSVIE